MYLNSLVNPCWCNWWNYCIQNEAELNIVDNVQKYTWKHMCIHSGGFPVTSVECLELWCHLKSPQRLSSWSWSDIKAAKNWDKYGRFESRGSQFNQRCYWLDKRLMLSDFSSLYCRMLQRSSYFKYIFFSQQAFKVKCNFLWFFFYFTFYPIPSVRNFELFLTMTWESGSLSVWRVYIHDVCTILELACLIGFK